MSTALISMTDKVAEKAEQLKEKLPEPKKAAKTAWQTAKPFVNGGLSGMLATCLIQPIDMVKVRLQLGAQGSPVSVVDVFLPNALKSH